MDIKNLVVEYRKQNMSFGEIAKILDIGKSTAFGYYKEYCLSKGMNLLSVPNASSEHVSHVFRTVVLNDVKEKNNLPVIPSQSEKKQEFYPINLPLEKPTLKEITANELIKQEFDVLDFESGFLALIGKPSVPFSGIIYGLPKSGKSNLCIRFADYLQEYFGRVVYIAAEEGITSTLKEKFLAIHGGFVNIVECRNREAIRDFLKSHEFDFVFIDSINIAGIDNEYLERLKGENPKKSFICIVQATKSGNFKGDQALTHNCDFIIKVDAGIAYHKGRFAGTTEINIFKTELYVKNPNKKIEEVKPEVILQKSEPLNSEPVLMSPIIKMSEPLNGLNIPLPDFKKSVQKVESRPLTPTEARWSRNIVIGIIALAVLSKLFSGDD